MALKQMNDVMEEFSGSGTRQVISLPEMLLLSGVKSSTSDLHTGQRCRGLDRDVHITGTGTQSDKHILKSLLTALILLITTSPSSSWTRGEARRWKDQWDPVHVVTVQAKELAP